MTETSEHSSRATTKDPANWVAAQSPKSKGINSSHGCREEDRCNDGGLQESFCWVRNSTEGNDMNVVERSKPVQRTMSVTEVAEVLGISRTTAYECVRTGDLPAIRLGGRIVVPTQAIDDLLERASAIPDA